MVMNKPRSNHHLPIVVEGNKSGANAGMDFTRVVGSLRLDDRG
jgi:hypothetical protein